MLSTRRAPTTQFENSAAPAGYAIAPIEVNWHSSRQKLGPVSRDARPAILVPPHIPASCATDLEIVHKRNNRPRARKTGVPVSFDGVVCGGAPGGIFQKFIGSPLLRLQICLLRRAAQSVQPPRSSRWVGAIVNKRSALNHRVGPATSLDEAAITRRRKVVTVVLASEAINREDRGPNRHLGHTTPDLPTKS